MHALEAALRPHFIEREPVIHLLLVSLIARQHVVLLGPAGTGKTRLAKAFGAATGLRTWAKLVSSGTTPDEIFGGIKVDSLATGQYERNPAQRLPEAQIGILDEIFKSSDFLAGSYLDIMEERCWENGGQLVPAPLEMLIGLSNEMPDADGKASAALWDRFAFRYTVSYIRDLSLWQAWLNDVAAPGYQPPALPVLLPPDELAALRAAAAQVDVRPTLPLLARVRAALADEGIAVSDRRWALAVSAARAETALAGRPAATGTDLRILEHVLWEQPDDHPVVRRAVYSVVAPLDLDALTLEDKAREELALIAAAENDSKRLLQAADGSMNLAKLIKSGERLLHEAQGQGTATDTIEQVLERLRAAYGQVMTLFQQPAQGG